MKGAAIIYLLTGLVILAVDLSGTLSNGVTLGTFLLAVFASSFFILASGLFRAKGNVRIYAIVLSALISLGMGASLAWLIADMSPGLQKFGAPPEFWWTFGPLGIVVLAHALALVLLLLGKPVHPNYSLKRTAADGLR